MDANPEGDAGDGPPAIFRVGGRSPGTVPLTSKLRPLCPPSTLSDSSPLNVQIGPFFNQLIFYVLPPVFCTSPQKWGGRQEKRGGDIPKKNFCSLRLQNLFPPPPLSKCDLI